MSEPPILRVLRAMIEAGDRERVYPPIVILHSNDFRLVAEYLGYPLNEPMQWHGVEITTKVWPAPRNPAPILHHRKREGGE